jgi:hypothetical protein
MPRLSVPAEIDKGSSSDAPHRHTDVHQGIASIAPGLTTLEERPLPFLGKILLGWNDLGPSLGRKLLKSGHTLRPERALCGTKQTQKKKVPVKPHR